MRFDELGCLISENGDWPGILGDSMAETSRAWILGDREGDLTRFKTIRGYVRHPNVPLDWRESDTSNDQFLPWALATGYFSREIKIRGTDTLFSFGSYFAVRKSWGLLNLVNFLQGLFFLLPYRWNDGHQRWERADDSSCDYLNHVCIWIYLKSIGRMAWLGTTRRTALLKVQEYYENEPNSEWLINLYRKHLT